MPEQEGLDFRYLEWVPRQKEPSRVDLEKWAGSPVARWFLASVELELLEVLSLLSSEAESIRSSELRGQLQGLRKVINLFEKARERQEEGDDE